MGTQAENVLLKLRELIMSGHFAPGDHLMEIPVAEQLEVSRTPVRWALGTLAQEGLLDYKPKRGFVVRGYSIKEIIDAVDARGALEAAACGVLAEKGPSTEVVGRIERNLEHTEKLARITKLGGEHVQQYCELNAEFHSTIVEASDNKMFQRFVSQIESIPFASPRTIAATTHNLGRIAYVVQRGLAMHRIIFEAIISRTPHRAEAMMREHVTQGSISLRAYLESVGKGADPSGAVSKLDSEMPAGSFRRGRMPSAGRRRGRK